MQFITEDLANQVIVKQDGMGYTARSEDYYFTARSGACERDNRDRTHPSRCNVRVAIEESPPGLLLSYI